MTLHAMALSSGAIARGDRLFRQCLMGALGLALVTALILLWVPVRRVAVARLDQIPERFARLVVREPARPKQRALPPSNIERPQSPATVAAPSPPPVAAATLPRRAERAALPADRGQEGRARAAQAAQNLEQATRSMERSLGGLSASLAQNQAQGPTPVTVGRRGRGVGAGRAAADLGALALPSGASVGADGAGSAVAGSWVSVGALSAGGGSGSESGADRSAEGAQGGLGAAPGQHRSNASLLAVIQRYSAGIQYCYSNELKGAPGLKGKLIVAMTVAASGAVTEARVVSNTTGSERLAACALGQIRDWRFPAIREGLTTFQTPFIFTPPE